MYLGSHNDGRNEMKRSCGRKTEGEIILVQTREEHTIETCQQETKGFRDSEGLGVTENLRSRRTGVAEDQGTGENTMGIEREIGRTGMRECQQEKAIAAT